MNNLNSVLIVGNLTRDPKLSYTGKGTAVARLGVLLRPGGRAAERDLVFRRGAALLGRPVYSEYRMS